MAKTAIRQSKSTFRIFITYFIFRYVNIRRSREQSKFICSAEASLAALPREPHPEGAGSNSLSSPPSRFRYKPTCPRGLPRRPCPGFPFGRCRRKCRLPVTFSFWSRTAVCISLIPKPSTYLFTPSKGVVLSRDSSTPSEGVGSELEFLLAGLALISYP